VLAGNGLKSKPKEHPKTDTPNTNTLWYLTKSPHTDTTNAERATRLVALSALTKG
jgi:hypothetical protein